jgi:flagellar M-ring protein FliF
MSEQNANNLVEAAIPRVLMTETEAHPVMKGLARLSIGKQVSLMLGIAFSVAIGVAVVLWSQTPSYGRLFAEIGEKDAADIIQVLDAQGIKYKVESGSGIILVPTDQVDEVKLKLAAQGLPKAKSLGYEILDQETGIGASKQVEMVRFQRALEGEIARTIMSIQSVKSARVLLALPVQSVFVRERKKPSASVVVNLYQGRSLEKEQVESIIHLVASSVPQLESSQVTVVDQKGRLLNSNDSAEANLTSKQFQHKKELEEHLMQRIESILSPLVGIEGMRTQISADLDFSVTENTKKEFNPDLPALRSEHISEQQSNLSPVQGIPGALSNQPTASGTAPETATGKDSQSGSGSAPGSASKNATKNYELDETISRTQKATGELRRLSVAVVIDDKHSVLADGTIKNQSYSQEDINRFSDLVKQSVGFASSRGDQVTVTNVAFKVPEAMEVIPDEPIWKQGWFLDLMKQVTAVLVVLFLLLGVLRPAIKRLGGRTEEEIKALLQAEAEAKAENSGATVKFDENGVPIAVPVAPEMANFALPSEVADMLLLDMPQSYEHRLEYVKRLVDDDPKIVAQVIKTWIKKDG